MKTILLNSIVLFLTVSTSVACSTTEQHQVVKAATLRPDTPYTGQRHTLVLGKVTNKSGYMSGMFSSDDDRIGAQGKQILITHLTDSQRFQLMDRANMEALAAESGHSGESQDIEGGQFLLTGAVTEFGRKVTGTKALGGILGGSKTQTAYGKVSISIVEVKTSRIIATVQGAGEYQLTNQQVLGTGSSAGYDATLTDKVLNLAMMEAVKSLIEGLDNGSVRLGS